MHNNKPTTDQISSSRRQFLRGAAAVSAVGLATSVGQSVAAETPVPVTQPVEAEQGYHETDHIRSYYASCR